MPRFLNASQIPMSTRRPHLDRYRKMLRESLHNRALAPEQRTFIKGQITEVGLSKVYGPHSKVSAASAVQPEEAATPAPDSPEPRVASQESVPDEAALNAMTKAEIQARAELESIDGVTTRLIKADMIEALLASRS